jgi:hypothetical protein
MRCRPTDLVARVVWAVTPAMVVRAVTVVRVPTPVVAQQLKLVARVESVAVAAPAVPVARAVTRAPRAPTAMVAMAERAAVPVLVATAVTAARAMPPILMVRPVVMAVILVRRVMLVARERWVPVVPVARLVSAVARVTRRPQGLTVVTAARGMTRLPTRAPHPVPPVVMVVRAVMPAASAMVAPVVRVAVV